MTSAPSPRSPSRQAIVGGALRSSSGRAAVERSRRCSSAERSLRTSSGQATVELVALLPVLLAVGLAAAALVAGHSAGEEAGMAAQAGAMALLQGGDPLDAARRALPAGVRDRARIEVEDRRVTVRVRPRLPVAAVAAAMTAEVSADAGPEPVP